MLLSDCQADTPLLRTAGSSIHTGSVRLRFHSRDVPAAERNFTHHHLWDFHTEEGAQHWRRLPASKWQCEWGWRRSAMSQSHGIKGGAADDAFMGQCFLLERRTSVDTHWRKGKKLKASSVSLKIECQLTFIKGNCSCSNITTLQFSKLLSYFVVC